MTEKNRKTQSPDAVADTGKIEESNAMKVLRGTGEDETNPYSSDIGGRKISKIEDFWYRHKWHAGIIIAVAVLAAVAVVQLITHVSPDVYIMYTGSQPIVGSHYDKLEEAIFDAMDDVNGDGKKAISFSDNTYVSPEEVEARRQKNPSYTIDGAANAAALERYQMEMTAGEHMICMLDKGLFDAMAEAGAFTPLSDIFGDSIPASAYGEYGIRLGDTEFYKSNYEVQFLPADTIIGLRQPAALDLKSEKKRAEYFERHEKVFKSIVTYTAKEVAE